jgi:hypothetical protein
MSLSLWGGGGGVWACGPQGSLNHTYPEVEIIRNRFLGNQKILEIDWPGPM